MSTATHSILVACEQAVAIAGLDEALAECGLCVRSADYAQAAAALDADGGGPLVVAPALAPERAGDDWRDVATELTRNFELIQRFVRSAIAQKRGGHLVALLPAAAAMGDPLDGGTSALTGGMLSLVRTLALEFRKLGMTANAVLYDRAGSGIEHAAAVASLVQTLVAQPGNAISGQTIFACSAGDTGRLHP